MADKCTWIGVSGKKYEYDIYPISNDLIDVPGNYIFAWESLPHRWQAICIGETESLKDRLPYHNELPCIRRNRGTHIYAHVNLADGATLDEEAGLLANYKTPCN